MKIGIDISQIVYGSGVSVYTQNLVEALLKVDRENDYVLFFSSLRRSLREFSFSGYRSVEVRKFKIPPTGWDFLWNRLHLLPLERLVGPVDVFHSSDWTQPPAKKARLVTTVHDLSFLRWPESAHPQVLAVQKRRLYWVKKEVAAIIAVSQATKKDLVELLGIEKERIKVIYEGLPADIEKFKPQETRFKTIKKRLAIKGGYLFAYGSRAPRKNIERLIRAFVEAKDIRRRYQLVIVGDYQPEEKLAQEVVLTGFLPREEMLTLFSQAEIFVYPSLYEGFGLPILEAFALGVPVVTSNLSSMVEVAGKAAVLVDPYSVAAISEGIRRVASQESLQQDLRKKGRERLKRFSWEKAARETLAVYFPPKNG